MDEGKKHINPCPILKANFISRLLYWWVAPVFALCNKRPIEKEDVYNVLEEDSSQYLCEKLEKEWNKELVKLKDNSGGKPPSLRRALARTFGPNYVVWLIAGVIEETVKIAQSLLLGKLILYFVVGSTMPSLDAYLYASGVGGCALILALMHHPYFLATFRAGIWMRVACSSLLYKKSLRLSSSALGETTVGQIVNLLSNDASRLDLSLYLAQYLLLAPVEVIVVFIILWFKIDWAAVSGSAFLVLLVPLLGIMSRLFARLRSMTASFTDERVRLMNELLNAMRIIKMYCWENVFNDLISATRKLEVERIMKASYARAMAYAPFFYSGKLIVFFTFLTYTLLGHTLTAEIVFVTISLYNTVRLAMTFLLPFGLQLGSEAMVAIDRLQVFLLLDELDTASLPSSNESTDEPKVSICSITASWDKELGVPILKDVSVEVGNGELLAVIGPVGTGKTSLLMTILGELPLRDGKIHVSGRIAYVSQQAWVFSASVRQNVTFGAEFNLEKYNRVIYAAALKKDLELMPEGDQTLVGERGVSLSGGQKARISLARALYSDADIYLLDDPLSAVDAHVSNHIFNKCISGLLRTKPRILVTHQLQYLKAADRILILGKDQKVSVGSYDELYRKGVDIETLLRCISEEEETARQSMSTQKRRVSFSKTIESDSVQRRFSRSKQRSPSIGQLSNGSAGDKELKETLLPSSLKRIGLLSDQDRTSSVGRIPEEEKGLAKKSESTVSVFTMNSAVFMNDIEEFVPQTQAEEGRVVGVIKPSLYFKYMLAGGGVLGLILCVLLNILSQATYILADWWLAYWCKEIERYHRVNSSSLSASDNTTSNQSDTFNVMDSSTMGYFIVKLFPHNEVFLKIFTGITLSVMFFALIRALHTFHMLVNASNQVHSRMLAAIFRCPISFFDTNPIGRILNRFSKDLGQTDDVLPLILYDFIQTALLIIGVILVVGILNPWVFIPTVPLCAFFVFLRQYFVKAFRSLKRLEATSKSPVFSHVSATVLGVQTIRAYGAQTVFTREFDAHQDVHSSVLYLFLIAGKWFAVRLELVCALFILAVGICSVLAAQSLDSGMVGLSLTYAITMMAMFQWGVRQSSEVESLMTSVERLVEYSELPPEAAFETRDPTIHLREWPAHGAIRADNVELKYSTDGAVVLKDLNFDILAGEKIGIVGRTGAGKSSLISMLFRLVEPTGKIIIDGVDILKIGLHDVRKKISIIPQDPVLLNGTVRKNLDPTDSKSDLQIWHALQQVQLKPMVEEMENGLDSLIHEGGSNISMGQKQLFCLARAMLMSNRIMIIDEATANVDQVTDALIQKTIRRQFEHCSVLTIAHRINTIIDSDRIMVLDEGRIVEFDSPYLLLHNTESHFCKMAKQTGSSEFDQLLSVAKEAHHNRKQRSETDNSEIKTERLVVAENGVTVSI